jgi:hypothetical protein
MKHSAYVKNSDVFYEMRPVLLMVLAISAFSYKFLVNGPSQLAMISYLCGAILVAVSFRIYTWRRSYRTPGFSN